MASTRPKSLYVGIVFIALAVLVKVAGDAAIRYERVQIPGTDNFREVTIEFWIPYPILILGTLEVLAIAYFLIRWFIQRNSN
jgi:hypothetical protein